MVSWIRCRLAWVVAGVALASLCCAPVRAQTGSGSDAQAAAPVVASAGSPSVPAVATSPSYVIGPGDVLQIFVFQSPELSVTVPVKPDGRITTPLIEDMVASGKTASQLARDMEAVLSAYIRTPRVNVIVATPRSSLSEVKVVGQVRTPLGVPYRDGMTVLDAVLACGGLTDYAAGNRAKIVRKEGDRTIDIKLRVQDIVRKGDLRTNVQLRPGDVLLIPESRF